MCFSSLSYSCLFSKGLKGVFLQAAAQKHPTCVYNPPPACSTGMLQNLLLNCDVNFIIGNSDQEWLGVPIIFQKSGELSGRNQVEISLLLPTLILPASGIWDEPRIVHEASDRHRVLLLPESVFIYSFLLVQLTCLVSEIFPPVFLTPGQGLSVVGSCGCGCQAAGDRLGR